MIVSRDGEGSSAGVVFLCLCLAIILAIGVYKGLDLLFPDKSPKKVIYNHAKKEYHDLSIKNNSKILGY